MKLLIGKTSTEMFKYQLFQYFQLCKNKTIQLAY